VTEGRTGLRLKVLAGLVAFMFAALTTRLWFLQVLATERYRSEAARNSVRLVRVPAPRGRILDDQGNILVGNRMSIEVTVNRQQVGDRRNEVLFKLSELLGVPVKILRQRLEDPRYYSFTPVPVAIDVSKRVAFYIAEHKDQFPGVTWVETPVRVYPYGTLASHVLGYLGSISAKQLGDPAFAGYDQNDLVGTSGVEAQYEHQLVGEKGYVKYLVNAAGRTLREIGYQAPAPGNDLVLTLDADIQKLAEGSLAYGMKQARGIFDEASGENLRATAGAVVVMDPNTGAVLAMASSPTYDPRIFEGGFTQREFDRLTAPYANNPLLNRAIAGQYPPGSTYKPFVALSGMARGFLSMTGSYPCPPTYQVPEDPHHQVWSNWSSVNLGYMSLARALAVSCDTVFYPVGYDYWRVYYPPPQLDGDPSNDSQPPKEPLQHDLRAIGFGAPTHVDLPGEQDGRVPDAEWKSKIHEEYPKLFPDGQWFPGDFVNMSIGQGDTLVTPLQLAAAYSAIANGGRLCVPHLGLRIQGADGAPIRRIRPRCNRRVPFSQELSYVRQALTEVPVSGTAAAAFQGFPFWEVPVAGKTGTAQVAPDQDYSWFAAMAPADDPRYVVVALVEQGGHGSTTAAPIVRNIIEGLFGLPRSGFVSGGVSD